MINIQSIQQLHCSRVSIVRWNLKEAGCEEHTNSWANHRQNKEKIESPLNPPWGIFFVA